MEKASVGLLFLSLSNFVLVASGLKWKRSKELLQMCSLADDMFLEIGHNAVGHRAASACSSHGNLAKQAGVDFVSFIQDDPDDSDHEAPVPVWIIGYPRSGSSTALSMVSATVDDNQNGASKTFSVFEPCHDGDIYTEEKEKEGCKSVLYGISRCHFKGIKRLWGMRDPHSTNNHIWGDHFSAHNAAQMCKVSRTIAFKTVDFGHNLKKWHWLLERSPNLRVINVVRDPRAIFASWKDTEPFATLVKSGGYYSIQDICRNFARNLDFNSSQVHNMKFEDMMESPEKATKRVYKFLGRKFGDRQKHWLKKTFNSTECPPPAPGMEGYQDCHVASTTSTPDKWRSVLSKDELASFRKSKNCQKVASAYGYPKE